MIMSFQMARLPWPSCNNPGFSSKWASEHDWIHLEGWFARTEIGIFFLEWAYLGCLNDRIVELSQHLLNEKIKSTTFALLPITIPKGSLDDPGKGDRVWTWPWPTLQAKSPQAQQGLWREVGIDDHETSFTLWKAWGKALATSQVS